MLDKISGNPKLQKYLVDFPKGQTVFVEGDPSEELYLLVSGELDVYKGNQIIATISQPGVIFGEMSFLLGGERTATVRARVDTKSIRIPKEQVEDFLGDFPEIRQEMTKILARRLDKSSRMLFGLRELCDQLPDAVVLQDQEGLVSSLNRAATKLYGKDWQRAVGRPVAELFEKPQDYKNLAAQAQAGGEVREQVLTTEQDQGGQRQVSLSLSVLYDAKRLPQGLLVVGRDVTQAEAAKRRLKRLRSWLTASLALLALFAGAAVMVYPYVMEEHQQLSHSKLAFKSQLGKDFMLLKSLLADALAKQDREKTSKVLDEFFSLQDKENSPYLGLVILDSGKKVFDAQSPHLRQSAKGMVGTSYGHINFEGDEDSLHKVLTVYRQAREGVGSTKSTEVAFEIIGEQGHLGWLIFIMNDKQLKQVHGVTPDILKDYHFNR